MVQQLDASGPQTRVVSVNVGAPREIDGPDDALTIGEFVRAIQDHDPGLLERLADNPFVSESWRERAARLALRS